MHILLTRPLEDSTEMILKFKSLGHQVSHVPLLKIEKVNYNEINFSDLEGIIFTSANAVKFLDVKTINKKIFCFCVGNATEIKAKAFFCVWGTCICVCAMSFEGGPLFSLLCLVESAVRRVGRVSCACRLVARRLARLLVCHVPS